jgi:hypothetical protein
MNSLNFLCFCNARLRLLNDPSHLVSVRSLGLTWIEGVISFGGVVGLATTLLIGLFAQARVYLSIARSV